MPPQYSKLYSEYIDLPARELLEIMADRGETGSKANFARHIYEERQREEQRKYDAEIFKKQRTVTYWSTGVLSVATLAAAIAAVYLAHTLQEVKTPPSAKPVAAQSLQQQTSGSTSVPDVKNKHGKVPSPFQPVK
jgi:cytoskeletal protein RodZ